MRRSGLGAGIRAEQLVTPHWAPVQRDDHFTLSYQGPMGGRESERERERYSIFYWDMM